MPLVSSLIELAGADTELLSNIESQGDNLSIPRDVDFILNAPSLEKAEIVSSFINDYRYGLASVRKLDGNFQVMIVINMPIEQQIICSISGFMACICELFGLTYDGWGCVVQQNQLAR